MSKKDAMQSTDSEKVNLENFPDEDVADQENQDEDLVEKLHEENEKVKRDLLRALAENENLHKRMSREKEDINKYAVTGFARELLEVSDNFEMAMTSIKGQDFEENQAVKNLVTGVEMTQKKLLSVFEKHGIKVVNPLGEKFDPNLHQAMMEVPSEDNEPGTIVQVLQAGYTIHDRLLRPAMVGVAKKG